ncbi:MAG: polyprenol monophosphomannose synthase [Candidatus Brocadiia bacterium]|jgi:dolichol-phosphate mannosyltransferase
MKPAVMLPTYNEAENLRKITEAVLRAAPEMTVVIVDDESPDGTGRLADELARASDRVRVIHRRTQRGRGYAGAEGFRYCVAQGFDPILEMDADLSHDPFYLPEFLAASREWDVVIGSRSVPGGGARDRGFGRRLITAGAAFYLRTMLGLKGVRDPTSGYRCFRRSVLESIHLETLTSPGPGIVTEILYRCRGFRIKEIPILFQDREKGRSKFNLRAMGESLALAARLRIKGR